MFVIRFCVFCTPELGAQNELAARELLGLRGRDGGKS